ncbi:10016_t:CDS:2 [Scutellospora calospora]|uniref:10016_t:CDS:1 n=1 Tax=Scutellospora calospora TaxID=85575 RepID=A0ACA9JUJ0_9GLOM|nr:10016_t:CDS:2 [Scutellospora calospora]
MIESEELSSYSPILHSKARSMQNFKALFLLNRKSSNAKESQKAKMT